MKTKIKICNLDCASCANELQEGLEKIKGVNSASVDFVKQTVYIDFQNEEALMASKNYCNHFEEVKVVEDNKGQIVNENKKTIILIIVSAILFLIAIILDKIIKIDLTYISIIVYLLAYLVIAYPVLIKTFKNIIHGRVFDENFLMSLASIGAMIISEMIEGVAVMLLYQIGELLQSIAVNSSRKEISSLVNLKSESANLLVENEIKVVPPEQLQVGDYIIIKNGEKVPVDCQIIDGNSSFDTKSLTGEALLRDFNVGEEILSGYINAGMIIKAQVKKTYENSSVAKILDLVENATSSKADSEKFITKFAKIYTPIVCLIALVVALIIPLIISLVEGNWEYNFSTWVYRALTLLVISCPCALVISVPLTYFGGIGRCAKIGVLVKGATNLDILSKANVVAFDKTGTLTEGSFKIINSKNYSDIDVIKIASSFEKGSNHPLAKAFEQIDDIYDVDNLTEVSGKGLIGYINKVKYFVGSKKLLQDNNIDIDEVDTISTIIYVADEKRLLGYIEIDDSLKKEAQTALIKLKEIGVNHQVMLTGDNIKRAQYIGNILKLDEIYGGLLPDEKLSKVQKLKQKGKLIYIGDGINDAPVMVNSDCAISMGKIGSDAAIEASDIVLIQDNLMDVVNAIKISRKTQKIVLENIIFSIGMKIIFMVLGIIGLIPLIVAVFADVGVMLIAVINSFRIKR